MATLEELERAFIAADDAGNAEDAAEFAAEIQRMRAQAAAPVAPVAPIQPVPAAPIAPAPPSGSEPLLYPGVPAQRVPSTGAFNPDMAIQSLSDIARGAGNAVTFGGTDYLRALLPGQTVEGAQAASAAAKERLGGEVALGTELAGGALLPIEGALAIADRIKRAGPIIKQAAGTVPKLIEDTVANIRNRMATESLPKSQIVKQEAKKIVDEFGDAMSRNERDALNAIISGKGGPLRRAVEKTATLKPTLGLGTKDLGLLTAGTAAAGQLGKLDLAAQAIGARVTAGLLGKGVVSGAKALSSRAANKDIKNLSKIFEREYVPTKLPPPKYGVEPASPKSVLAEPKPKPAAPSGPNPSLVNKSDDELKALAKTYEPKPAVPPEPEVDVEALYRALEEKTAKIPAPKPEKKASTLSLKKPTTQSVEELKAKFYKDNPKKVQKPKSLLAEPKPAPKPKVKPESAVPKKAAKKAEERKPTVELTPEELERRKEMMKGILAKKAKPSGKKRGIGSY